MEYINSLKFSILDDLLYKKELKRIIILTLYNAHYEKMKSLLNILSLQKMIINNIFYQSERDRPILNIKVSMNIGNPDFLKNLLKMCLQKEIFLLVSMEKFQYFIPDFEINLIETNIWVATIIKSERIPIEMLLEWFKLLESYSIKALIISDLTDISFKCIECKLKVPKLLKKKEIKEKAFFLTQKYSLDVLLQSDSVYKKKKRLIAFDMDSTLIEQEMIDEIARFCGIFEKVSAITQASMNGKIDFSESLKQRVSLLKGVHLKVFEDLKKKIVFTEGAHSLCKILKKNGFKTAVISGGFMPIANYIKEVLNLDYAYANNIEISENGLYLTGNIDGPIIDGQKKAEILKSIANIENIDINETIAVGDGFNDLWMLNTAGLGIAFNAKPKLQEKAPNTLNAKSLMNILYVLGYSEKEQIEMLKT
ncbi:phosphoserine phosphatase SerB [Pneumocystis jirovecii RU7]|uniref:phosphoserine phosphatase n=1 Tax=Pneumocystis jirovecii (strain RU7) TaxID=1408657 RepID=A0A0W4ZV52_PNEJ7|nr:phosphoserine phosphatase SerB [Pneumocystis jirovecii RU7]KTW32264.1 phosphoserine phosphatase SerB [Pneumocystis jirovecii RU7]